jgi:putative nucleotidyltransferase with HDIG domain
LANIALKDPIFKKIADAARRLNMPAFVVGGYVRDMLLERPCKDVDVVVEGSGIQLAEHLAAELGEGIHVHVFRNFGTAMIHFEGWDLEFVGARKESYNRNSRKPAVENGTIAEDQARRDFTINALAIPLNPWSDKVTDPFNGIDDLQQKILRTPGNPETTYSDDPLRMMRAIRFACQLGFSIEESSLNAIQTCKDRISIVSAERITDELNKIILSPKPSKGFKLLSDSGILALIFPEMMALHGVEVVQGKGHKDNFYHTLEVLDNVSRHSNDLWLRWAAILHDIAKPLTKKFEPGHGWTFHGHEDKGARMVAGIFRRLKLPLNEKMKFVQKLVQLHLRPIVLSKDTVTDSAVRRLLFEAGEDIDHLMALCRADITSKNPEKVKRYIANFELVEQKLIEIEEKDRIRNWQPPVSGSDIMETFGIGPGREIGIIKTVIREAILDGQINNEFESAYQLMLDEGRKLGLHPVKNITHSTPQPHENKP